jgi:glycosyltransferase involved in cell wall biosynthesis
LAPTTTVSIPDRLLRLGWRWIPQSCLSLDRTWQSINGYLSTCLMTPRLKRTCTISIIYDVIPLRCPQFFPNHRAFLALVRETLDRSDKLIAISHQTKADVVNLLGVEPDRLHVVYPGRHEEWSAITDDSLSAIRARYGLPPRYLLYLGSLGPHKNVSTLLRAFALARETGRLNIPLVIVGDPRWGEQTLQVLKDLHIRRHVILTGRVPDSDVPAMYAGATAFVFPSLYEGFGLPVLDAMTCGIPAITSTGGALPEVVGAGGMCLPPDSIEAWADTLCRISRDDGLRARLGQEGRARAAQFSWQTSAAQVCRLFEAGQGYREAA